MLAPLGRTLAALFFKPSRKVVLIEETRLFSDLTDGVIGGFKELIGFLKSNRSEKGTERDPAFALELAV